MKQFDLTKCSAYDVLKEVIDKLGIKDWCEEPYIPHAFFSDVKWQKGRKSMVITCEIGRNKSLYMGFYPSEVGEEDDRSGEIIMTKHGEIMVEMYVGDYKTSSQAYIRLEEAVEKVFHELS
jgi:hypothetical protein